MEEERRSYYAIIPADVRYDEELSANAKLLYGEVTSLCCEQGFCWARNEYFSKLYKVSKKSVSRWLSQLTQKGYIQIEIIRDKDTKEVSKRKIFLTHTPMDKNVHTYGQNCPYPMDKNVPENNTSMNNTNNNYIYSQVIDYLNEKSGKHYRVSRSATSHIKARIAEGATLDDFKTVIDKKSDEWLNTDMEQYLRPETLFGTKFDGYLNQPVKGKEQPKDYNVDEWNDKYKEIADRKERELYEKYGIDYE